MTTSDSSDRFWNTEDARVRFGTLLAWMKEHKIQVRFKRADYSMMFAPKPAAWPAEMRELGQDKDVGILLIRALYPVSRITSFGPIHPLWSVSSLAICYGCRRSCATRDPLGHSRHPWCGWLNQPSELEGIKKVAGYPGRKQPPGYKGQK